MTPFAVIAGFTITVAEATEWRTAQENKTTTGRSVVVGINVGLHWTGQMTASLAPEQARLLAAALSMAADYAERLWRERPDKP